MKIVERLKPVALQKNLTLSCILKNQADALIDTRLFEKAMEELLNNAIKFTGSGGIRVVLERMVHDGLPVTEIRVSDTGIGIAGEYHQVIFESFRQVSGGYGRSYEGTGLGLTIAKKIIELLHGELLLESEIDKGSTFIIRLPGTGFETLQVEVPAMAETVAPVEMEVTPKPASPRPKLLLVEDNEDNVFLTTQFCQDTFTVDATLNGVDAIALAREKAYAVILMDINLGFGINGLETAGEIRKIEKNSKTPVVAMTGFTFKDDQKHILAHGCDYYLAKPFTKTEILGLLEKILHRSGLPPQVLLHDNSPDNKNQSNQR